MSKITRFDVYGNANYSDRGTLVLYDHHKEVVEDLERQLEEAREALNSIRGILPTVHSSDREIHEIINKVLKEQG